MSEATIDLLLSTESVMAVLIGAVGLGALIVWRAVTREPFPVGGVVLTAGALVALALAGRSAPPLVIVGVVALGVGGLVRSSSFVVRFAVAIPGAAVIGTQLLDGPLAYLPGAAVAGIVIFAPLVAWFDRAFRASTLATPLLAVSFIAIFFVVPDTEVALIIGSASGLWLFSGPPGMVTRLGGAGAYVSVGLLVWEVAIGGVARPASLVAGVATLGVLVAVPVILALGSASKRSVIATQTDGTLAQQFSTVAVQIAVGLLMTVVVSIGRGNLLLTIVLAFGILTVAGISVVSVWGSGRPVDAAPSERSGSSTSNV